MTYEERIKADYSRYRKLLTDAEREGNLSRRDMTALRQLAGVTKPVKRRLPSMTLGEANLNDGSHEDLSSYQGD